jgi:CubicO group peptidase (beta-lactamase class C family)
MLQVFLAERLKLTLHHDPKSVWSYVLTVGKGGPKLQANSTPGFHDCSPTKGTAEQIHLLCHANSMSDLAELLPQVAPAYLEQPVVDKTGLKGIYDFQLDWMGRRPYDAAVAAVAAGAAKDPLAVSIFDAVAQLGLSLDKHEDHLDAIVVDSAERISGKNLAAKTHTASVSELTTDQVNNIDRFVREEMTAEQIPGLAVGIYNRGNVLLAKGYGLANVELGVPVKPETIFQSGSVGKQFVSAAVMLLVEQGKVGLDDSIVKYFPDAPASWKAILVKNLLSHTSGLAEYETGERAGPKGPFYLRLDFSEDELVERVEALPIDFAPGEQWAYRNTNYLLLGIMIHKVTGEPYADYLREKLFKPWYMASTRLISEKDIIPNRASGYELVAHRLKNQDWVSPTFNSTGDGTLYFNVLDLAKWDEALYGTSLLKQSSLNRIWTVFPLNSGQLNRADYGFGWSISNANGHKVIQHGGAWQGFTCVIQRYVDDNLTVVVLTNLAGANPGRFANKIAGLVNPALMPPPPKQHKEAAVNPKLFVGYVGKYQISSDLTITITQEGEHLFAQPSNQPKFMLFAEGERDFFLKVVDAQITFVTDNQGRATELILHQNGDQHAKRVE